MGTVTEEKLEYFHEQIPSGIEATSKQVISLWGGGVDCCLACWKGSKEGLNIKYFYTAIPENYDRVSSYGLKTDLITIQAESMGVTPILKRINPENYEQFLIESLQNLKQMNVEVKVWVYECGNQSRGLMASGAPCCTFIEAILPVDLAEDC